MKTKATHQNLLEVLEIDKLTPEEQEELLLEVSELVYNGTLLRLVGMMDDKTKDDFEKLLETDPKEDEVQVFLDERVPDSDKAIEDTILEMRDDILAVTGAS